MKTKKNHLKDSFVDDEENVSLKSREHRRPIRNWTKAWVEHETDADEIDDFYTRKY